MTNQIRTGILLGIILLLITIGSGYFIYQMRSRQVEENKVSEALEAAEKEAAIAKLELEKIKAAENEAKSMLEAEQARKKELDEKRIEELNNRLKEEDAIRKQAEKDAAALNAKMALLKEELETAKKKSAELIARQKQIEENTTAKLDQEAKAKLEAEKAAKIAAANQIREQELKNMENTRLALQNKQEEAIIKQIAIEEEILSSGGTIHIENYNIRSKNYRRREAILLNERIKVRTDPNGVSD